MRGKLFLKIGMFLIKPLDSNGLVVNRKKKRRSHPMNDGYKIIDYHDVPNQTFRFQHVGQTLPISTIIGNIILRYNS